MAAKNPDSLDNQDQFHARVVPAEPVGHKWHKPGNEQGNDAKPEYHAQSFPPGTAPPENTFRPNPINADIGQANNPDSMHQEGHTGALDMPGSTSKDIHNSIDFEHGKPMQGQTNREIRGAHAGRNKKEAGGLEGVGASTNDSVFDQVRQQAADKDNVEKGQRGYTGEREGGMAAAGAEGIPPVSAEQQPARQGARE